MEDKLERAYRETNEGIMDRGLVILCFMSLSTVFQSFYQEDGRVMIKGCE